MPVRFLGRALFAAILISANSSYAQISPAELDTLITEQIRAASQRWGVSPTIRITDSGRSESSPLGRITIAREPIQRAIGPLPADQARMVVSWIVAHEVWHQVQFRDLGTDRGSESEARLSECAADAMAADIVLRSEVSTARARLGEEPPPGLVDAIGRIIGTAENFEIGFNGQLDHPTSNQRRAAIRYGFGRAMHVLYPTISDSPTRDLERDRIGRIYDIRRDESDMAWSSRVCRRILHSGDGVGDLEVGHAEINWNRTADNPVVDYRIPYVNHGPLAIRVNLQVRSVTIPRISPDDAGSWTIADERTYQFDLAAGQTYWVAGRLTWYATEAAYPRLVFAPDLETAYDVERLAALPSATPSAVPIGLTPDLIRLRSVVQTISATALDEFTGVIRDCEIVEGTRTCQLTMPVPGVVEAFAEMESTGSSEVVLTIYQGPSDEAANAAYSEFRLRLRTIFPAAAFNDRPEHDGRKSLSFTPATGALFELRKLLRSNGTFIVSATIVPQRF
jgi:hypothetical protein